METMDNVIEYTQDLKLLYVEDNAGAREATLILLEEFFENIVIAVDGEDGYEKYLESSPDIIITDINMPKQNGIEMITKIRETNSSIPILILSAHNETSYFIESIKLNVNGYIFKPVDIDQIVSELDKIVSTLKLHDEIKKSEFFLKQYQEVTDISSIVSKTNPRGVITYVNENFCKISGYSPDELVGKNHNIIRHPDVPKAIFEDMWNTIKKEKKIWQGVVRNLSKDKKSYYVKSTVKPIMDIDGNIIEYIALRDDITDIMNPQKQFRDDVKNLQNPFVVYMKLDEFDTLEEFYEHETIEKIESEISKFLEQNLPTSCKFEKVYQLGNGEFALISEQDICLKECDDYIGELKKFQNVIRDGVIDIDGVDYDMSILISIAYGGKQILENVKLGIKELLKSKQNFIIANDLAQKARDKAKENKKTLTMVKKAISNYKIISYFQPIINNKTKKIEKYESLVRLIDEDDKVLSPFFFLDTAKKGRYYSQITNMVLINSFNALKITNMDISMNLSALDIELEATREKIFELLDENKEYTSRVVFELLEDENIKDFNTIKKFITDVKNLGVKIAIDDFGAGYSNFERLLDYQPDILKIDGCLIRNIQTDNYSLSVVKTIVAFAKEQEIQTVAEFVENEEIFNILNGLGVDYSQGYHFGKPEPLE
jgi:PAS domain S-box-containing protein